MGGFPSVEVWENVLDLAREERRVLVDRTASPQYGEPIDLRPAS